MKKQNLIVICIGMIITIASFIMSFMFYKSLNNLVIYARKDSYAYSYAKTNLIRRIEISDSDQDKFTLKLEDFDYNIVNKEIEIVGYEGISKELVIPSYIDGYRVTTIKKGAIPKTVKTLILSPNMKKITASDFTKTSIKCYKNDFCKDLKKKDKLDVSYISDSDNYYFINANKEFTYNIERGKLTITNYIGEDNLVIIPETINGYEVNSLKFDGTGIVGMYIPNTVKSISGDITSSLVNKYFVTTSTIVIISFAVFALCNIFIRNDKLVDLVYRMPKYIASIIYLLVISYFMHSMRVNPIDYNKYIIASIIATLIYILLAIVFTLVHKSNKEFDKKVKQSGSFIREACGLIEDLNKEDYDDIKELLKYSDPVSIEEVKDIEKDIIKNIKEDNKEELKVLINKRNRIIKENK